MAAAGAAASQHACGASCGVCGLGDRRGRWRSPKRIWRYPSKDKILGWSHLVSFQLSLISCLHDGDGAEALLLGPQAALLLGPELLPDPTDWLKDAGQTALGQRSVSALLPTSLQTPLCLVNTLQGSYYFQPLSSLCSPRVGTSVTFFLCSHTTRELVSSPAAGIMLSSFFVFFLCVS